MPISLKARAFIESNLDHYREVTLAVKTFEAEVEAALRSIWGEYQRQLDAIGLPDNPAFEAETGDDQSDMCLRTRSSTGIQIALGLQCRDDDDRSVRFAAYSGVWVKNAELRVKP